MPVHSILNRLKHRPPNYFPISLSRFFSLVTLLYRRGQGGILGLGLTTHWSAVVNYCQILPLLSGEHKDSYQVPQSRWMKKRQTAHRGYRCLIRDPLGGRLGSVYGYVCVCICLLRGYSGYLTGPHLRYCIDL